MEQVSASEKNVWNSKKWKQETSSKAHSNMWHISLNTEGFLMNTSRLMKI